MALKIITVTNIKCIFTEVEAIFLNTDAVSSKNVLLLHQKLQFSVSELH